MSVPVNLQTFEKFVQASDLGVFNPETHEGYWRQLMVRLSTGSDQLMLVVGMHPQTLSQEEFKKVKDDLKGFFENGEGKTCNVASLYFQHIMRRWGMKLDLLLNSKLVYLCVVA
jgi:tRNA (uracil-5-)-methyltransferase